MNKVIERIELALGPVLDGIIYLPQWMQDTGQAITLTFATVLVVTVALPFGILGHTLRIFGAVYEKCRRSL